jgi:phosphoribosylanthranilate isomerase
MLSTKVKASSVTHLTDARYFAAWEVEWLGFYLSPGDDASIDPLQVNAIREWVDGVRICGEFNLATTAEVRTALEMLPLDAVQVGMLTPAETLREIAPLTPLLQEIVVESYSDPASIEELLSEHQSLVQLFILNFTKGGITWQDLADGTPFDLAQLKAWTSEFPILLDIPLGETDPVQVATDYQLQGFSVRGGEEEKVGYKSFDELDDFFEALIVEEE